MTCLPILQAEVTNHLLGQTSCVWLPLGNQAEGGSWWIWALGVLIVILLNSLFASAHEAKREEDSDIMATQQGIINRQADVLYDIKAGKADWSEYERLEAELQALEKTVEIAPGEGAYLRRKR